MNQSIGRFPPHLLILRKRAALSRRMGGKIWSKGPILRDAARAAPQDEEVER
ncbi:hypothetical protein Q669_25865 [Labrenzia sp. C1B10]|nr:hypothetical protein Q669_25865 [Labrenzia sp. C1B10]ERS08909.1 hypothetical protein Q675_15990 [Labrenzia sp. C1B70]